MLNKQDCKYGDNCTFAYHQEEIDVWTEERKGTLNRDLLFDPLGGLKRGSLTIAKLLKEHQGIFTFLCEVSGAGAGTREGAVIFSVIYAMSILIYGWAVGPSYLGPCPQKQQCLQGWWENKITQEAPEQLYDLVCRRGLISAPAGDQPTL